MSSERYCNLKPFHFSILLLHHKFYPSHRYFFISETNKLMVKYDCDR